MLANLLVNLPVSKVGTKTVALDPVTASSTKQCTAMSAGSRSQINTDKAVTTDNKRLIAPDKSVNKLSQNFKSALRKKTISITSGETETNKKRENQDQGSAAFSKMHLAQFLTVQELLAARAGFYKADGAKVNSQSKQQAGSETSGELAQFVTGSKVITVPSPVAQVAKLINPTPENKLIQSITDQSHIKSKTILTDISNKSNSINTQSEENKDTAKSQVSDKTFAAIEKPSDQEKSGEWLCEVFPGNNKINAMGEKAIMADEPIIMPDTQTPLGDTKTASDGEQSVVKNELFAPNSPKTQPSHNLSAALKNQSSHSPQKVFISQDKPVQAAQEITVDKTETDRNGHRGKTKLLELQGREGVHVESFSVKSIAQKVSQPQTQLSAQQTETHNNSLSNHASKPDMEVSAQVLIGNNPQIVIKEQPPTVATAFAKVAGSADSGAGVSEQIHESIHSSFRLGNEQIVIRLNPPELGKVAVKLQKQADNVTGLIQVDKPQTKHQIEQVLPEIIQNLQSSGIKIKELEVVLTNPQERYASRDQSSTGGQDNWSGQQNSPNPESQKTDTTYNEWLTNISGDTEVIGPQVKLTDGSIDILI